MKTEPFTGAGRPQQVRVFKWGLSGEFFDASPKVTRAFPVI
jgi:hypothetical protein